MAAKSIALAQKSVRATRESPALSVGNLPGPLRNPFIWVHSSWSASPRKVRGHSQSKSHQETKTEFKKTLKLMYVIMDETGVLSSKYFLAGIVESLSNSVLKLQ